MSYPVIEAGRTYRLRRNWEIRDEKTGIMKHFILGGTEVKVKRVVPEEDHVYLEGVPLPVPLAAFERAVDPVQE